MSQFLQHYPVFLLLLPLVVFILIADASGWHLWGQSCSETQPTDTTICRQILIQEIPAERAKTWRLESEGTLLYLRKDSTRPAPQLGDSLRVCAAMRAPSPIGSFDYPRYLRRKGISAIGYAAAEDWQVTGYRQMHGPRIWQLRLKERLAELLGTNSAYGIVAALTLGWREDLDDDTRHSFQRAGAAHILAVSGLHTGILMSVLMMLLTGFGLWQPLYDERKKITLLTLSVCGLLWLYAALTGWTPSVVRSVVMACVAGVAVIARRKPVSLNSVALAALLILTVRPYDLFSVSFQLSFAAVTAIVLLTSSELYQDLRLRKNRWWKRPVQYILDLGLISLAAWLGTLPLSLVYYGYGTSYFLLTNMIVIPAAFVLVTLTLAMLTIGWMGPVGYGLARLVRYATDAMNSAVQWVEELPGATFQLDVTPGMAVCMYVFMLSALLTIRKESLWWLVPAGAACGGFIVLHYGNSLVI